MITDLARTSDKGPERMRTTPAADIEIGLLTGGQDRPYAFGLAMALLARGVCMDVIGSDEVDSPEMHTTPGINFLNLRGNQRRAAGMGEKIRRVLVYYAQLIRYAAVAKPKVFHILWNNRVEYFDRTLLMVYYRACGKKIVLTAHNVNAARRDAQDSWLNRLTLKIQYRLTSHIFVHTEKMKAELISDFGVPAEFITVLIHPVNDAFPETALTPAEAKRQLGIAQTDRTMLFFGRLQPYKGLEYLLDALELLSPKRGDYKLIIAGEPKRGSEAYEEQIERGIAPLVERGTVIPRLRFIRDDEIELYFKAADVLVLPYKEIFQSGVLFLGLTFGLPAVASDVGSFHEDLIEERTGWLCRPGDVPDLARALEAYFESALFRNLDVRRSEIRSMALEQHSWGPVADLTRDVYGKLLGRKAD